MAKSSWGIVIVLVLFLSVVSACDTEDNNPDSPEVVATTTPIPSPSVRPNSTIVRFIPVTATFTPSITPSPTPTLTPLPFRAEDFIGSWPITLDYTLDNVPGIEGIDTWRYRSRVTIDVNETGLAIGRGQFTANVGDLRCTVEVLDDDELDFFLSGQIRQEGDVTFFDLTVEPLDPEAIERYSVICLEEDEVREIEISHLWPTIIDAGLVNFSPAVSTGERIINVTGTTGDDDAPVGVRLELLR